MERKPATSPATRTFTPRPPDWLAAVDLGSNSFHLIVARVQDGRVHVVDRLREPVRLAMGLDERGSLRRNAQERAFDALAKFGQRVRYFRPGTVRAVGTNTLRLANGAKAFRKKAERLLGHPIEIISGEEEARLVYLGVAHDVEPPRGRRLVVDIGGGSTEVILGEALTIDRAESLHMGCASYTQAFFPKGRIRRKSMDKATTAARLELEPIKHELRDGRWEHALGASGTIRAVARFAAARGFCTTGITAEGLAQVRQVLIDARDVDTLSLDEVSATRRPVFAAGVAILSAVFRDLGIERMQVAGGALREGALYDLLGRFQHEDVREETVARLMRRYGVDGDQARRVEEASRDLLEQVFADWQLKGADAENMLAWASRLHEIGMSISHSGYHRHGAYLLTNSNMAGFSRGDQIVLAALVLSHRRKLRSAVFEQVPSDRQKFALRLAVLLRLAARLHRSRSPSAPPPVRIDVKDDEIWLTLPPGWLESNALTRADLDEEADLLTNAGFYLRYS